MVPVTVDVLCLAGGDCLSCQLTRRHNITSCSYYYTGPMAIMIVEELVISPSSLGARGLKLLWGGVILFGICTSIDRGEWVD